MKKLITLLLVLLTGFVFIQEPQNIKDWEKYFTDNISTLDDIEGIYKSTWYSIKYYNGELIHRNPDHDMEMLMPYLVIKKNNQGYIRYLVSSEYSAKYDILLKTYSENKFIKKNEKLSISYFDNPDISYQNGEFILKFTMDYNSILNEYLENKSTSLKYKDYELLASRTKRILEQNMIKHFPTKEMTNKAKIENIAVQGTGFAITSNGIIVTNFHVIEGAKSIKVRGVNSDFSKTYKAKVLVSDKNNDLALIQIDDYGFTSLGTIPFIIKAGLAGVGENIFVLGYPLRATMGDEIKLTNGIVSSRTGFQGDITSYQISAPVQPGNSGGPLFDKQGNLIGIINAKHGGAENASYAVKSSYLAGLIELLSSPPKLQTVNSLSGKTLTQQVEMVNKFVYIIETE